MRARRGIGGLFVGSAALLTLVSMVVLQPAPAAQGDLPPDLRMARISDIRIDKTFDGRRLLRYTATIVNVGAGPFELNIHRDTTSGPWSTTQRVYTATGYRLAPTSLNMVYGGDGHNHWHVQDLESTVIDRKDGNPGTYGVGAKRGFCFWDTVAHAALPGAPRNPVYTSCGTLSSLDLTLGLSIGWADVYRWDLPDQYVDITGLGPGRYRLTVTADNSNRFVESDETNNTTWVELQIKGQGAPKITAYGPAA
jgi:hypothetical protein